MAGSTGGPMSPLSSAPLPHCPWPVRSCLLQPQPGPGECTAWLAAAEDARRAAELQGSSMQAKSVPAHTGLWTPSSVGV